MKKLNKGFLSIFTLVCLLFTTINTQAIESNFAEEISYTTSINYGNFNDAAEININYDYQDINYVVLPNGKKQVNDLNRTNYVVFENGTHTFTVNYNINNEIKEEIVNVDIDAITAKATPNDEKNAFFYGKAGHERYDEYLNGSFYYDGAEEIKIISENHKITIPSTAGEITNYDYELKGWYDVYGGIYYSANNFGNEIPINEDKFFYPDYFSKHYDYGNSNDNYLIEEQFSTNTFIKTEVFDYNELFNLYSVKPKYNYDYEDHKPYITWSLKDRFTEETLNFVFFNYFFASAPGTIDNTYTSLYMPFDKYYDYNNTIVRPGLITGADNKLTQYGEELLNRLFSQNDNTLGKRFVGYGDNLYQYKNLTNIDESRYVIDSGSFSTNYNQTDQRFYTYEIPSYFKGSTMDYNNNKLTETMSTTKLNGFFPFNYPSCNNDELITNNNGRLNYSFGLKSQISFYLPETPGTVDANKGVDGNDMIFNFNGDDDLWIFIDDELILDFGGIHGPTFGEINFSTAVVTYTDNVGKLSTNDLSDSIKSGDHKLTVYYLERGSSLSNLYISFNLLPKYDLTLRKIDTESNKPIEGVDFEIYTDEECTTPANFDNAPILTTNSDGEIICTNLELDSTYYIKEASVPDGYVDNTDNVIKLEITSNGAVKVTNSLNDSGVLNTDAENSDGNILIEVNNTKLTDVPDVPNDSDVPTGVDNNINIFNVLFILSAISLLVYLVRSHFNKCKA